VFLLAVGGLLIVMASREVGTDRTVSATIVSSGCTVSVRTAGSKVVAFHVDLCPSIPAGSPVRLVDEGGQVVDLLVGSSDISVATSQSTLNVTGAVICLIFGVAFLVLFAAGSMARLRRLPRPRTAMFAVLVIEVVLPVVIGLIAAMQPLHPDGGSELSAAAIGALIGTVLALFTAVTFRNEGFHRVS
jgi:hypothetical protein